MLPAFAEGLLLLISRRTRDHRAISAIIHSSYLMSGQFAIFLCLPGHVARSFSRTMHPLVLWHRLIESWCVDEHVVSICIIHNLKFNPFIIVENL